ncbi:MAG TPA: hypothetical protein VES36_07945 [Candidatus Limnocylindrales bacterium]|nr:hypothetical protein [Candidatus Limnocylindrales bacterium]
MLRGRFLRHRLPRLRRQVHVLPSLYDAHPAATTALRRPRGLQVVPLDRIVGTVRHPSQNTAGFLPLPGLRGRNWEGRWQRIRRATDNLSILPAVELFKVGDNYYVNDGHNRIAAALQGGGVDIDADVTELMIPGVEPSTDPEGEHHDAATLLLGADELRQAAAGRQSRTAEHRPQVDELRREQLTSDAELPPEHGE